MRSFDIVENEFTTVLSDLEELKKSLPCVKDMPAAVQAIQEKAGILYQDLMSSAYAKLLDVTDFTKHTMRLFNLDLRMIHLVEPNSLSLPSDPAAGTQDAVQDCVQKTLKQLEVTKPPGSPKPLEEPSSVSVSLLDTDEKRLAHYTDLVSKFLKFSSSLNKHSPLFLQTIEKFLDVIVAAYQSLLDADSSSNWMSNISGQVTRDLHEHLTAKLTAVEDSLTSQLGSLSLATATPLTSVGSTAHTVDHQSDDSTEVGRHPNDVEEEARDEFLDELLEKVGKCIDWDNPRKSVKDVIALIAKEREELDMQIIILSSPEIIESMPKDQVPPPDALINIKKNRQVLTEILNALSMSERNDFTVDTLEVVRGRHSSAFDGNEVIDCLLSACVPVPPPDQSADRLIEILREKIEKEKEEVQQNSPHNAGSLFIPCATATPCEQKLGALLFVKEQGGFTQDNKDNVKELYPSAFTDDPLGQKFSDTWVYEEARQQQQSTHTSSIISHR